MKSKIKTLDERIDSTKNEMQLNDEKMGEEQDRRSELSGLEGK